MGEARARGSYEQRQAHPKGKRKPSFRLEDVSVRFPIKGFWRWWSSQRTRLKRPRRRIRGLRTQDRRRGWNKNMRAEKSR